MFIPFAPGRREAELLDILAPFSLVSVQEQLALNRTEGFDCYYRYQQEGARRVDGH